MNHYAKFFIICFVILTAISCKKDSTSNDSAAPAKKQGSLLFWTNDAAVIPTCGVLTVKLSNGQQSNITGYYFVAPNNCANQFGGYFLLDEGTYTYQISAGSCFLPGGTATVVGNTCNFAKVN